MCRTCGGEGNVVEAICPKCQGDSRLRREEEIDVEVPPGVSSENFITLRGRGNVGPRGGPRGDVVVLLEVEEDERFIRQGSNLAAELPVTFAQVALGDRTEIDGLEQKIAVEIPAGTQSGQVLRLRGQGLPDLETRKRGDLLVHLRVWTPAKLTPEEEKVLRALKEVSQTPPARIESSDGRGFWSRVKDAFRS
jgi:molecular chaperone DnaJ